MAAKAVVDQEIQIKAGKRLSLIGTWCKSCGICVEFCPRNVLALEESARRIVIVAAQRCTACGLCELYCPDYVFSIHDDSESA